MRSTIISIVLIVLSGLLINGCKKPPPPEPTAAEQQLEKLSAHTWKIAGTADAVTIAGNTVITDWASFTISFGDGTYTATGAYSPEVWPSSGTWTFPSETDVNTLQRDDGIDIAISVTDATLQMTFDYTATGGRLNGIEGTWVFNMIPQ
ncbi:MAG: hypothetical protein ABFS32_05560 [Bacteroidota bacterium]